MNLYLEPIPKIEKDLVKNIQKKLDNKTKPVGALGRIEEIAMQVALIQESLNPKLNRVCCVTIAADHDIVEEGVSCAPAEITWQQMENFSRGGGAIGLFAKTNNVDLVLVDAGINHDIDPKCNIIDAKVRKGTRNFRHEQAMTPEEFEIAFNRGRKIVKELNNKGCNTVCFGEMGIGNSTPASALLSVYTKTEPSKCVGAGGGLKPEGIEIKKQVIEDAIKLHGYPEDPLEVLRRYGGLEIAMLTGGMYEAAMNRMLIIVDGYITSSAALAAYEIDNNIKDYFILSHASSEGGHKYMVEHLNLKPILNLDLRLGEGTGAVLAYPIIKTAVNMLTEMTSFEEAEVFNSSDLTRL